MLPKNKLRQWPEFCLVMDFIRCCNYVKFRVVNHIIVDKGFDVSEVSSTSDVLLKWYLQENNGTNRLGSNSYAKHACPNLYNQRPTVEFICKATSILYEKVLCAMPSHRFSFPIPVQMPRVPRKINTTHFQFIFILFREAVRALERGT
jgi:hypothetical protein